MKRIKIIICSLLAIFLMMMLPAVSAIEANAAKETRNSKYLLEIQEIDFKKLKEKYEDDNVEPTFIILYTFLIWFFRVLRWVDVGILFILFLIISRIIGNNTTELSLTNT